MSKENGTGFNFVYELSGATQINVFELAPALLSVGELVRESNAIINPNSPNLAVNVKAFREGSFIVDLYLATLPALPLLPAVASSTNQLLEVLKSVGLIAGLPGNLIDAIRVLKGRPVKIDEVGPGEIRYSSHADVSITVNGDVHNLIQSASVRENAARALKPLSSPEVNGISSYIPGEETTRVNVGKDILESLDGFANGVVPSFEPETENINMSELYVHPRRGPCDGTGGKWSFYRGDSIQSAIMKDKVFLERCARGEIRLHATDLLKVRLIERQRIVGTQVQTSWEIPEVLEYRRGPSQKFLQGAEESTS